MPDSDDLDVQQILQSGLVKDLLGSDQASETIQGENVNAAKFWQERVLANVDDHLKKNANSEDATRAIVQIGRAALNAFLQACVTGPPLEWQPEIVFQSLDRQPDSQKFNEQLQSQLRASLSVDGEAVYHLLPHVELFSLAKIILNHASLKETITTVRWRLRVNVWHQRLLGNISYGLEECIYRDLEFCQSRDPQPDFLIEKASIDVLHGHDANARNHLDLASDQLGFQYVLTGRLGKRTKFQQKELSQLVVLARSRDDSSLMEQGTRKESTEKIPEALNLNDDTLLESVAFSKGLATAAVEDDTVPTVLASIDPAQQPKLNPLDSIILLMVASSITNTSPQHGLTREETLPYAERVISGGSSNWQIYTQALLVRSRIEGHKSRTIERGVLQLQALVDQIIAELESSEKSSGDAPTTTFLPKSKSSDTAPAKERLRYIHQLASPPRWKLEAELADRWVSLGGLRTALEIYERLEMWPEVALCWAANDREDKARRIIRKQLYNPVITISTPKLLDDEDDTDLGQYRVERTPLPLDAPRMFCILGDIEDSPTAYERAWEISGHRYARAQRSLGKYYLLHDDPKRADDAYALSLKVNPQNHATWFALGCVRLQLEEWRSAAIAFGKAVQIEDTDAESWSNLAIALLKVSDGSDAEDLLEVRQRHLRDSFAALKRAATLKRESFRIWQNLLSVSIKLEPAPYNDIIIAQTRLIEILGASEGERCIDVPIMEALLADVIRSSVQSVTDAGSDSVGGPMTGTAKMTNDLILKKIAPLITSSRRLWLLVAKLHLHSSRPHAALNAYEKAWRSQLNQPGWDNNSSSREQWHEVADATIDLMDAYESLGERTREAGMGEGEVVAKDWKFKARSASRSVLARAKETWEDDDEYERLQVRLNDFKS